MSLRPAFRRIGALPVSRVVETGFGVFAIYIFSQAQFWPSAPSRDAPLSVDLTARDFANPLNYVISTLIFLVSLALVVKRPRALWRAATADLLLTGLLGLTLASMLWSDAPDVVFRRWGALFGTTLFAVYLHLRYSLEEQLRLVGWGLGITAIFSILLFTPSALSGDGFRGIYENKNSLGRMMALSVTIFVLLASIRRPRALPIMFAGLSFVLLLMAKSSTALVVALTVVSLIPVLRILARDMRLAVGVGGIAILVLGIGSLLVASNLGAATAVVGRDATLTGRTDLWQYVVEMILRRPWLGYGYETFWLWELPWRAVVDEGAGWTAPNAHNGFLEVGLALGFVGVVLFVTGLMSGLVRAIKHLQGKPERIGLWPPIYLCFVLLYNITEIAALTRNTLVWVLYVSALLAVAPKKERTDGRAVRAPAQPRAGRPFQVSAAPVGPMEGSYERSPLMGQGRRDGEPLQ